MAQTVKNLSVMWETQVWSLGQEDSLKKGMATLQYSCLESSMDRGVWQATVHGVTELDMTEWLTLSQNKMEIILKKDNDWQFFEIEKNTLLVELSSHSIVKLLKTKEQDRTLTVKGKQNTIWKEGIIRQTYNWFLNRNKRS